MSLAKWWASKNTCPKYIVHCTCDSEVSQEAMFDWWSTSHIFWGAVYSLPLFFWDNDGLCLAITILAACLFELFENTKCGRHISGIVCCTKNYAGDNFWNSFADVICCVVGYGIVLAIKLVID